MAYSMVCNTKMDVKQVASELRRVITDQDGYMACRIKRWPATRLDDARDIIYIDGGMSNKVPYEMRSGRLQKLLDLLEWYGHNCGFETVSKADHGHLWLKKVHYSFHKIGEWKANYGCAFYNLEDMIEGNPFQNKGAGLYTYKGIEFQIQPDIDNKPMVCFKDNPNVYYGSDQWKLMDQWLEPSEEYIEVEQEGPFGGAFRNEADYWNYRDSGLAAEARRNDFNSRF